VTTNASWGYSGAVPAASPVASARERAETRTDYTGAEFDRWTVLDDCLDTTHASGRRVLCRCACGFRKFVALASLLRGTSRQCANCARTDPRRFEAMRQANVELERVPPAEGRWLFERQRQAKPGTFRKRAA
jgi:hypothetical protein